MKSMPIEKRNRVILVGIASAIVVGVLWMVLISSQQRSLQEAKRRIADANQKLDNGQRLVRSRDSLEAQLVSYREKLATVEESMVTGDMYSWVIRTVNDFKTAHRVDIPQFSRERSADVGILPKFPYTAAIFDIRGTGFFHDVALFVADFENTFPFISVRNLLLEPALLGGAVTGGDSEAPDESEKLSFQFELVVLIKSGESL